MPNSMRKNKSSSGSPLFPIVESIMKKKGSINKLAGIHKTPFYVFDKPSLNESIDSFLFSFKKEVPLFKAYFALKINNHPFVIDTVVEKGMGLDVGSPAEIDLAVRSGCKEIVYFSPGKTKEDLLHALKYN